MRALLLLLLLILPMAAAQNYGFQLPDLVVSSIDLPSDLPQDSYLESIPVTITNNGPGALAYGPVWVKTEINTPRGQYCQVSDIIRNAPGKIYPFIRHRTTVALGPKASAKWDIRRAECRIPVNEELTIKVTVDPPGTGTVAQRGYIPETDEFNNGRTITVKPTKIYQEVTGPEKVTLRFSAGTSYFSMPVISEMTAQELLAATGCRRISETTSTKAAETKKIPGALRADAFTPTPPSSILKPNAIYSIDCIGDAEIEVSGYDPGPLAVKLGDKSMTPVASRVKLNGHAVYDIANCPGERIYRFAAYGPRGQTKPYPSDTEFFPAIVPGEVYLIRCPLAGTWDAAQVMPAVPRGRDRPVRYG